ncbi:hypothetical protein QYF61_013080 [Mycteria americana]|uniref:Uncharacterized protein n=1 Tax=Mycteria americana TaxID=33587 RepID=A0AAN7N7W1_MYCAM|nr:hypothetical protein QYF61_013080 [Mycteria americana]
MPCWHHVVHMEDGPLFGTHGAAAQHEPNTDTVSDTGRRFPGTAVRIILAWTVKGNEEIARRLEKIGRGVTRETSLLAASPASSHGAVTRHHPETRLLAPAQDADLAGRRLSIRGNNRERGLVRRTAREQRGLALLLRRAGAMRGPRCRLP